MIGSLVFMPPDWPGVLLPAAAAALAWELGALLRAIWRGRPPAAALGLTVGAVLAGPLLAAVAGVWAAVSSAERGATKGLLSACLRGTLLAVLAVLTIYWMPAGAPGGAIVALAACAAIWSVRAYRRTTAPLQRGWKGFFLAMRLLVLLLLALVLLRPTLEYTRTEEVRRLVLIGVDTSASMQRRDAPQAYTDLAPPPGQAPARRIDSVIQAFASNLRRMRNLVGQADVTVFTFSTASNTLAEYRQDNPPRQAPDLPSATGPATAIGDSAAAMFEQAVRAGRKVAAIVLVSDGSNNTSAAVEPGKFATAMAAAGVPVHTVGVGSEEVLGGTHTLNIKELLAPDEVQAFNRLSATARLEAIGLDGRDIEVTWTFGEKEVSVKQISVSGGRMEQVLEFSHVPTEVGSHRLKATARVLGEKVKDLAGRPEDSKLVRVFDTGLRILYVEGRFRFESKYIMRALTSGRRFTVDRRVLLQPLRADQPPALSEDLDDWLSYHAIILGDVDHTHFTPKQLEIIKELVGRRGKGFCMIGGSKSFGRGGWAQTPLADVLPVVLAQATGQIEQDVKPLPTREGALSGILQIGEGGQDAAAAWAMLPEMPGANRFGELKLGAVVLARDRRTHSPMIVSQQYGSGRVLAVAFDTTWRWVLTPEENTGEMQKRFWRQVALYLAAPRGNIWIQTQTNEFDLRKLAAGRQSIEVTAGVEDASGRPIRNPPVRVTLQGPGMDKPALVALTPRDDRLATTLRPPPRPGLYTLRIESEVGGKPLSAEHRFEIVERDIESLDVLANLGLLREIARTGKGRYVPLAELPDLLESLPVEARAEKKQRAAFDELTEELRWPLLAAYVALLCVEWAVRKRKGLV